MLAVALIAAMLALTAAPLKVGYLTGGASQFGAVANDLGIFKQEGVEVELIPFSSSPDALNALNSGKLDVAAGFGTCPPLGFIARGADFVFIAGHMTGGHAVFGTPQLAAHYHSLKDLKGKRVASPRLYTPDVILKGGLVEAGISFGPEGARKDVTIVEVRNGPQALDVLKSGKVDAAALVANEIPLALAAGFKPLAWSTDIFPGHPCCRVAVKRSFLQENRPVLVKFLRAWIRAERVKKDNPDAYIASYAKQANIDLVKAKATLFEPHVGHEANPNAKAIVKMWNFMRSIDYIQSNIDIRTHIDTTLYKEALDSLSREHHGDKYYAQLQKRYTVQNTKLQGVAGAFPWLQQAAREEGREQRWASI